MRASMDIPIAIVVIAAFGGLYASVDPSASLPSLWRLLLGVAIYYGLAHGVRNRLHVRWLSLALLGACLVMSLLTLFGTRWSIVRLASWPQVYDHLPVLFRAADGDGQFHPRMMGMALATLFPIPVALLLFDRVGLHRILSASLVLLMAIAMLLTQSVQALMGIGAALFVLAVWRSRWFLVCLPLGAALLWWGISTYGVAPLASRLLSLNDLFGLGVVLRMDIWSRALEMIGDMPFTGIGLNTFPIIQQAFYPGYAIGPELHAHNLFLQVELDLGLFGLAAFISLLIVAGITLVKGYALCSDGQARALLAGLGLALTAYIASQTIETYWETAPNIIFWILLGLASGVCHPQAHPTMGEIRRQDAAKAARALLWLWPPALLALSLLAAPHIWGRNLAILRAHKQLSAVRSSSPPSDQTLMSTIQNLQAAQIWTPDDVQLFSLIERLYAVRGDYGPAIAALERRVALDMRDPIGRYAPFEALRRRIAREAEPSRSDDLIRVHLQWRQRFPKRAEEYVQLAIIWGRYKGEAKAAIANLEAGLASGAEPRGLLIYYRRLLAGMVSN